MKKILKQHAVKSRGSYNKPDYLLIKPSEFTIKFEYQEEEFIGKVTPYKEDPDKFKIKFEGYNIPIDFVHTDEGWKGQWIGDQTLIDAIGEAILMELNSVYKQPAH
jgi:hypothetical protein